MNPALAFIALAQTSPPVDTGSYVVQFLAVAAILASGIFSILTIVATSRANAQKTLIDNVVDQNNRFQKTIAEMQTTINNVSEKLDTAQDENRALKTRVETLEREGKAEKERAAMAERKLADDLAAAEAREKRALEREVKLEGMVNELKATIADRDATIAQLHADWTASDLQHDEDLTKMQTERDDAVKRAEAFERELNDTRAELLEAREEIARLRAEAAERTVPGPTETPTLGPSEVPEAKPSEVKADGDAPSTS